MLRSLFLILTVLVALLSGCETSGGDGDDGPSIPECEKLFRVAEACFSKNPEAKVTMSEGIDQVRDMLKPKGGQPLERAKITDVCRQRLATLEAGCK